VGRLMRVDTDDHRHGVPPRARVKRHHGHS
jgi:hypothetical protein